MNVKEIVKVYLEANGFDGLGNDRHDTCACLLDDLMSCDKATERCEPGYKAPCDCGDEEHRYHMYCTKEEVAEAEREVARMESEIRRQRDEIARLSQRCAVCKHSRHRLEEMGAYYEAWIGPNCYAQGEDHSRDIPEDGLCDLPGKWEELNAD